VLGASRTRWVMVLTRWVILLACLCAPAAAQDPDQDIAASVERLKALREELESSRKKAEDLGGRERGLSGEIRDLERDLDLTQQILEKLGERERGLRQDLAATQAALEEGQRRLAWRKQELARDLRQMYKHGRYHSLEILFSSKSFPNLLERVRFLGSVAQRNRQHVRQLEKEQAGIDRARRDLLQQTRELERLKSESEGERKRIGRAVEDRTGILERVRSEKSQYERMVADLEQAAQALENLITRMEAERAARVGAPAGGFEGRRGTLMPPVEGEVVVAFGRHRHAKFGTVTFSNGVDYRANLGAPVRAVASGRVEHVSWLTGYGQCVILGHGGGYYTLYAHLSEVLVMAGRDVHEGDSIGRVGETGSLIGPSLHFEVRKGREALDPAEWVRSR